MDIGSKIRALRLESGLTQEELAKRLALSKGYISQLEHNLASPSMNTLFSVLEVLGTEPSDFFSETNEEVVYKPSMFVKSENGDLKHNISAILPNSIKYDMEPIIIEIQPGGSSLLYKRHTGDEFGYVFEGEISLYLNKKRHIVKTNETFYFKATKSHQLTNHSNKKAKVLWISTPPMF